MISEKMNFVKRNGRIALHTISKKERKITSNPTSIAVGARTFPEPLLRPGDLAQEGVLWVSNIFLQEAKGKDDVGF